MKKVTSVILITTLLLPACGGRAANPVLQSQYGDQRKSCAALEIEMQGIQQEIQRLEPQTEKDGKNAALGVAGALFLVPWFFMDFSHAEQEEINAYRQRYNNLAGLAVDKKCDVDTRPLPEPKFKKSEDKIPAYPNSK